jgi:hypothetical protein
VSAADGPIALGANGVHACTVGQLPQWLGDELWRIELDGEVLEADAAVVASRGRLLGPVAAWDAEAQRAFAVDCRDRARELTSGGPVLAVIERFALDGRAAAAGYWAAVLAGERLAGCRAGAAYDAAFERERVQQARWLAAALEPGRG